MKRNTLRDIVASSRPWSRNKTRFYEICWFLGTAELFHTVPFIKNNTPIQIDIFRACKLNLTLFIDVWLLTLPKNSFSIYLFKTHIKTLYITRYFVIGIYFYLVPFDIYDFFRLRNELDRNQFLHVNDNEWIIPDLFKVFYFEYLFRCCHAVQ